MDHGHPSVTPVDGRLTYEEGLFIGYRAYDRDGRGPLFPFGHGLGYTQWTYDKVEGPAERTGGDAVTVRVSLTNTGLRAGREVVQVYASRPDSAIERPVRWLAGFAPVELEAGRSTTVEIVVPARAFDHWDAEFGRWATEPGAFRLEVGSSSRDLRLSCDV